MQILSQEPARLVVLLPAALYAREVVLKSVYWLADSLSTQLDWRAGSQTFVLTFEPLEPGGPLPQWEAVLVRLKTNLIDYATRQLVAQETRDIRTILLAKAFAQSDELDAVPPGSFFV
jgi:His-Xaa-Ser system protein HxsD